MKILHDTTTLAWAFLASLLVLSTPRAFADACATEAGLNNFITVELNHAGLNPNVEKVYNLAKDSSGFTVFIISPGSGSVYSYKLSPDCAAELFQLEAASPKQEFSRAAAGSPAAPIIGSSASAVGDFNGDGHADLALAVPGNNSVTVFLGASDGTVGAGTPYAVGTAPASIAAADINADGHLDLIVANHGDNTVSILLGRGDGTFQAAKNYPAGTGPAAIAVGDFNQDGKPDLAIGTQSYSVDAYLGAVEILLNTGNGAFAAPVAYASGTAPQSLVAADFNGDGILDLAVGDTNANRVLMLLGNKGGTFQPGLPVNVGGYPDYLVAADFNHDGQLDLAVLHGNAQIISVAPGKGDGTFGSPASLDAVYGSTAFFPVGYQNGDGNLFPVGDFDGDGNLDILLFDGLSNEIRIAFGRGDGSFTGPPAYPFGSQPTSTFLAVADFSGSGKQDAITDDQLTDEVYYFAGSGDGTFQPPVNLMQGLTLPQTGFSAAVTGDFNGDGQPDLAVAGRFNDSVTLFLSKGGGEFQAPIQFPSGGPAPTGIAAADFDGDGHLDLAVANSADYKGGTGNLVLFKGDGKGNFTRTTTLTSTGLSPAVVAAADLNGDGQPDLVVTDAGNFSGSDSGALYVLLNKGNGSFAPPAVYLNGMLPGAIALGDVNGDGKLDLAVSNVQGVLVMLGAGDGTFQAPVYTQAFGASSIAIADLNGDGKRDLMLGSCCGPTELSYLPGNGDGTFQSPFQLSAGSSPATIAIADLNGDGAPDILVAGGSGGSAGSLIPMLSTGPPPLTFVTALATAGQVEPFAAEAIVSAYGSSLATTTAGATVIPLPLSLKGTSVTVVDSAGVSRGAPLFYVSPAQINYEIPAGSALGPATVTIANQGAGSQVESIQIGAVSPGVFLLDADALIAAWVLPVVAGTQQALQPVFELKSGAVAPLPIDVAAPNTQYYVEIYGTGIRNAGQVTATVGGANVPVLFYGAAPAYAGLDQINIGPLPVSLTGKGSVSVVISADGQAANTSKITIQ